MNNDELKNKICKIIADNYLPKEMPDRWADYKLYRFARAADALIAAGLGFMNDDITAQIVATIKRDIAPITMECVALRKRVMEAEHRAEIAEKKYKLLFQKYDSFFNGVTYCHKNFSDVDREITEQAERELAEEGKDD